MTKFFRALILSAVAVVILTVFCGIIYLNEVGIWSINGKAKADQSISTGYIQQGDALDIWINRLARNENCKTEIKDGKLIGTWDSGSFSYGPLCFKKGTFIGYVKQFKLLLYATDEEIMNFIGDTRFQKQLTRLMMEDNYNNWRHWRNTVLGFVNKDGHKIIGIGYPPKI